MHSLKQGVGAGSFFFFECAVAFSKRMVVWSARHQCPNTNALPMEQKHTVVSGLGRSTQSLSLCCWRSHQWLLLELLSAAWRKVLIGKTVLCCMFEGPLRVRETTCIRYKVALNWRIPSSDIYLPGFSIRKIFILENSPLYSGLHLTSSRTLRCPKQSPHSVLGRLQLRRWQRNTLVLRVPLTLHLPNQ